MTGLGAVVRQEVVDSLRRRRQLVFRALTPILLIGLLLGIELTSGSDELVSERDYLVAVDGDLEGASATVEALAADTRLTLVERSDARIAADDDADLGLVFPPDFDRRLEAGDASSLVTILRYDRAGRAAFALTARSVNDRWRTSLDGPAATNRLFDIEVVETEPDGDAPGILGQLVSAVVVLQAATVIGGAAARFTTRRSVGVLQTQLLLPLSRTGLAVAKGVAESLVALVAASPLVVGLASVTLVVLAVQGAALVGVSAFVIILVSTVALLFPAASYGVAVGCGARSRQGASVAAALGVVVLATVASLVSLAPETGPPGLALVPVAGVAHAVRLAVDGDLSPLVLFVALASTVASGLALAVVAARYLSTERLAQRASA